MLSKSYFAVLKTIHSDMYTLFQAGSEKALRPPPPHEGYTYIFLSSFRSVSFQTKSLATTGLFVGWLGVSHRSRHCRRALSPFWKIVRAGDWWVSRTSVVGEGGSRWLRAVGWRCFCKGGLLGEKEHGMESWVFFAVKISAVAWAWVWVS